MTRPSCSLPSRLPAIGVGVAVAVALVAGLGASPAWAAPASGSAAGAPVVGDFGLGDGLEGMLDERTGAATTSLPVAGLGVTWSSRAAAGDDLFGLGAGWSWAGVGFVDNSDGVFVHPPSGGRFAADASATTGLSGYVTEDVRFRVETGELPARPDGAAGERPYAYVLAELGGTTSYFDEAGHPVAMIDAVGHRTDWTWDHRRLVSVISELGVVSTIEYGETITVTTATAAGTGARSASIELGDGGVRGIVDAVGGRIALEYDGVLLSGIEGPSGTATKVDWQTLRDGSQAVERMQMRDGASGDVLSQKTWTAEENLASGWPEYAGDAEVFNAGNDDFRYTTALADEATTVRSTYNAAHLLIERTVEVSTPRGPVELTSQEFTYPGTEDGGVPDPAALPPQFNRPTATALIYADGSGRERHVDEEYAFDAFGRATTRTGPDGTVSETVYDDVVPEGAEVPVGLPVLERTTAPDGQVTETHHELNPARTAVTVTETFTGVQGGELHRTGRTEYTVEADGFVSVVRAFPQGGEGTPLITERSRDVDLVQGTVTIAETVAAGTDLALTSTEVSDLVAGHPVQTIDPLGRTATTEYDAAGRVIAKTDPTGAVATAEYLTEQSDGINATVVTTPDGVVVTEERDGLGRVVRVTDNILDGAPTPGHERVVESREYPDAATTVVTDAWGASTTARQDVFGRTVETIAPTGLRQVTQYDDVDNQVTTGVTTTGRLSDAPATSTQSRDVSGRVTESSGTRHDGAAVLTATSVYDGFGRTLSATDGIIATSIDRDAQGNPVTTTVAPAAETAAEGVTVASGMDDTLVAQRRFDERGVSVEKILRQGEQSRSGGTRTLDALGRVVAETDQDGETTTYTYTADGLVDTVTTGYGSVTRHEYAPVTRAVLRTETTSPIGDSVTTGFEYHEVTGALVAVFDPADRAGTEIRYAYDAWGNTAETRYPGGATVTNDYDEHGRRMATTDTTGTTTDFEYDAKSGLPVAATQTDQDGRELSRVSYTYDDHGRVTRLDRGNDVTTSYAFTSLNEIAEETTTDGNGNTLAHRAYTYDARGNLIARTDTTAATGLPVDGTGTTTAYGYGYDLRNRLVRSTIHDGDTLDAPVIQDTAYDVSVSGDIDRETVTVSDPDTGEQTVTERTFEYSPTGHLTAIVDDGIRTEQSYDAAGNLSRAADGTRYEYDALNRTVATTAPDGATVATDHWATGNRRALHTGTASTLFHYDGGTLTTETHTQTATGSDAAVAAPVSYLLGAGRHARTLHAADSGQPAATEYYVHDRHGNVTETTGLTGATTAAYTYSDYGVATVLQSTAGRTPGADTSTEDDQTVASAPAGADRVGDATRNPFQYSGEYTNPDGTQHLTIRTYDPQSMRFTTEDPASLHNTFAYANLNPTMMVDPSGRTADFDTILNWVLVGLAIIGSFISAIPTLGVPLPLIIIGTGSAIADLALATTTTLNSYVVDFLDDTAVEALDATGIALAGIGLITDLGPGIAKGAKHLAAKLGKADAADAPIPSSGAHGPITSNTDHLTGQGLWDGSMTAEHASLVNQLQPEHVKFVGRSWSHAAKTPGVLEGARAAGYGDFKVGFSADPASVISSETTSLGIRMTGASAPQPANRPDFAKGLWHEFGHAVKTGLEDSGRWSPSMNAQVETLMAAYKQRWKHSAATADREALNYLTEGGYPGDETFADLYSTAVDNDELTFSRIWGAENVSTWRSLMGDVDAAILSSH